MSNTLYWDPSSDADVASYWLESAASSSGPWSALATVTHAIPGADYLAGPPAQFFYVHSAGTLSTWYRLRVRDSIAQYSAYCDPFQVGQTSAALSTSALDIVQMALAEVGETTTIASLVNPTTKGEKLGVLFYERTRDRMLRKLSPQWAVRRAALVQLTDHERAGWSYVYALPTDLLKVVDLDLGYRAGSQGMGTLYASSLSGVPYDPSAPATPLPAAAWAIEANNTATGKVLCCDLAPGCSLVYIAQLVDPTLWSPDFTEAVLWGVAAKLAMPLAVKPDLAARAEQMARQTLAEAIADDANEQRPDRQPDSEIISARSW